MSTLLNIGIKQQDGSYKNYTLSLNDETNGYGQNVSVWESQTKEQQAAKEQRNFVGNGKVVWTDGNVKVADKVVTNISTESQVLPPNEETTFILYSVFGAKLIIVKSLIAGAKIVVFARVHPVGETTVS